MKSVVYAPCGVWELRTNKEECVLAPPPPFPPANIQSTHPVHHYLPVQQPSSFRNILSEWEQSQDTFSCLNLPCGTIPTGSSNLSKIKSSFPHSHWLYKAIFLSSCETSASTLEIPVTGLFAFWTFAICYWCEIARRELWPGEWSGRSEALSTREELRAGAYFFSIVKTFLQIYPF